jgi:hypothetical protein
MPLRLGALSLTRVVAAPDVLMRGLAASYIADAIVRSPALIGSLDLLGNPTNLVRSIAAGVSDVFAMPLRARSLAGLGLGWASLAGHVSEGVLSSLAGFAVSLSRNVDRLLQEETGAGAPGGTSSGSSSDGSGGSGGGAGGGGRGGGGGGGGGEGARGVRTSPWRLHADAAPPGFAAVPLLVVPSEDEEQVVVAGPSLSLGLEGLGRGLLGAVEGLARARGAGSVLVGLGRGIARPAAGLLELAANVAATAADAVHPHLTHAAPCEWAECAMLGPPPAVLRSAGELAGGDAAVRVLCPCSIEGVEGERFWLVVSAAAAGTFGFVRHGGDFAALLLPGMGPALRCEGVVLGELGSDGASTLILSLTAPASSAPTPASSAFAASAAPASSPFGAPRARRVTVIVPAERRSTVLEALREGARN